MNALDSEFGGWLPDMDLNHDKQIQSLLCYRYTIGQTGGRKVICPLAQSTLINTLLQRGGCAPPRAGNRFSGRHRVETAEAVENPFPRPATPLKRGVNENGAGAFGKRAGEIRWRKSRPTCGGFPRINTSTV